MKFLCEGINFMLKHGDIIKNLVVVRFVKSRIITI